MKKIITYIIFIFSITHVAAEEIRGIHISATGNNRYECAIRANIEGMQRSLSLAANKIGILNPSFAPVPYQELKDVFTIINTTGEQITEEQYSANVTYAYDNLKLNQLALKYGSQLVRDQYFEYIIIPVFKQKNVVSFLDTKTEWLDTWIKSIDLCSSNKLLPIDPTKDASGITPDNIFSMKYEDFLNKLRVKRFKKILIASCEYFTREDGSMYFSVMTKELTSLTNNKSEIKYNLYNPKEAKSYFNIAIEKIISSYGQSAQTAMHHNNGEHVSFGSERILANDKGAKAGHVLDELLSDKKKGKILNKIEMRADIFSHDALESLKAKLGLIKEIIKFQINLDDNKNYIVTLYSELTLKELSEGFYVHQISYRTAQDGYVMFELEAGI